MAMISTALVYSSYKESLLKLEAIKDPELFAKQQQKKDAIDIFYLLTFLSRSVNSGSNDAMYHPRDGTLIPVYIGETEMPYTDTPLPKITPDQILEFHRVCEKEFAEYAYHGNKFDPTDEMAVKNPWTRISYNWDTGCFEPQKPLRAGWWRIRTSKSHFKKQELAPIQDAYLDTEEASIRPRRLVNWLTRTRVDSSFNTHMIRVLARAFARILLPRYSYPSLENRIADLILSFCRVELQSGR